jgi:excisionase family DNA binding protein
MVAAKEVAELWRVADVMRVLGVKKSWVYARVDSGELPVIRLPGGRIRFDPVDIVTWIDRQKQKVARVLSLHRRD